MKILVAMSGGVDSSVVAHKLAREGHELIGVMMKLWTDPLAPEMQRVLPSKCCSVEHIQRARDVCTVLSIPFYVVHLEDEFKKEVVDPFIQGYRNGITPNPCIHCNRKIKFGKLLTKMKEFGCDKLATGHYARIAEDKHSDGSVHHLLLEAMDETKDQSYYLYGLSQEQLRDVLFPLGSMSKSEVYKLANQFGILISAHYRESQDLCFFPEKEPTDFLKRYIPDALPGKIQTEDGTVVGTHKGLPFYTIGQRKGLGVGGLKIPLHVTRKEHKSNTVFVAPSGADLKLLVRASSWQWVSWVPPEKQEFHLHARISSLGNKRSGVFKRNGNIGAFEFSTGVRGAAPGQSMVLYKDHEIVGGGVIV